MAAIWLNISTTFIAHCSSKFVSISSISSTQFFSSWHKLSKIVCPVLSSFSIISRNFSWLFHKGCRLSGTPWKWASTFNGSTTPRIGDLVTWPTSACGQNINGLKTLSLGLGVAVNQWQEVPGSGERTEIWLPVVRKGPVIQTSSLRRIDIMSDMEKFPEIAKNNKKFIS